MDTYPVAGSALGAVGNYNKAMANTNLRGATETTPSESASQIRDAIGTTEQIATDLHEALSHLESRLDTVLCPVPPTGADASKSMPEPVRSHLLGRVLSVNGSLSAAIDRVRHLRSRVEV
jgi:hypothetical protein